MKPDFVKRYLQSLPASRQRLLFVFCAVGLGMLGVIMILSVFRDNIVYFYTPTELQFRRQAAHEPVRVGGLIEMGSVHKNPQGALEFIITDGSNRVRVIYTGVVPDLFRPAQGVIAEGMLDNGGTLVAERILTKHDERYMPKDVVDRLKRSGYWRGEGTLPAGMPPPVQVPAKPQMPPHR